MNVGNRTFPSQPDAGRTSIHHGDAMPHRQSAQPTRAPRVRVVPDHFPGLAAVNIFGSGGDLIVKLVVRQDYLDCDFVRRCEDWITEKEAERAALAAEPAPASPRLALL